MKDSFYEEFKKLINMIRSQSLDRPLPANSPYIPKENVKRPEEDEICFMGYCLDGWQVDENGNLYWDEGADE